MKNIRNPPSFPNFMTLRYEKITTSELYERLNLVGGGYSPPPSTKRKKNPLKTDSLLKFRTPGKHKILGNWVRFNKNKRKIRTQCHWYYHSQLFVSFCLLETYYLLVLYGPCKSLARGLRISTSFPPSEKLRKVFD